MPASQIAIAGFVFFTDVVSNIIDNFSFAIVSLL